jgi:hypothetical protein
MIWLAVFNHNIALTLVADFLDRFGIWLGAGAGVEVGQPADVLDVLDGERGWLGGRVVAGNGPGCQATSLFRVQLEVLVTDWS